MPRTKKATEKPVAAKRKYAKKKVHNIPNPVKEVKLTSIPNTDFTVQGKGWKLTVDTLTCKGIDVSTISPVMR